MKHASPLDSALPPVSHVKSNSHHCIPLATFFQSAACYHGFFQKAARSIKAMPGCKDQIHHSLFYHELPLRRLTHLTFDLDTNATWRWQTKLHNPMIYYMICWLATCGSSHHLQRRSQHCIKFQILSRLRTPWQYYPAFWVFFERSHVVEDPVPKKMKIKKNTSLLPKAGQKVSMYQCWKEKLDTIQWAPYRLSLLFPKFKALQFHDLESRIRANFCAVPPQKMCTIEPLCRPRSLPLLPMPPHRASFLQ